VREYPEVDVGALLEQLLGALEVAGADGEVQGRHPLIVDTVGVGPVLEQDLANPKEKTFNYPTTMVRASTKRPYLDAFGVAAKGGVVQGRPIVEVLTVHRGTALKQSRKTVRPIGVRRLVQRIRPAIMEEIQEKKPT
jgi:hypothetical protein